MTQTLQKPAHLREDVQPERERRPIVRAAARGVIGSMAMSGLRQLTTALGMVPSTPPESVLKRTAPKAFHSVPDERRPAVVEAVHWTYGAVGGAFFGLLPKAVRRRRWAGPVYGVLAWAAFETAIAPALGLTRRHGRAERVALLADHVLYGIVVGAAPRPSKKRHHEDAEQAPPSWLQERP
ncbi:unnamed protein product [[Actinomadura] parvosata subsp. kistnae]|uniref:DUF1440 domain-containing protein n=1 Tax=[Actinomadura] parvosata subsp. kistnae TaxID=1909395 RepID=A0A1V0AD70_9ACTN|nr:DUF6789 family protein [Nonomuraea sp. ATCC 55076]AQZ68119.1 hypothetical protein BKM31_47605 [Nonomuraea sp. ATCC 55076]SPL93496.1 unnamed protein product [Actinomadura parvosata subsp. kistnae]